MSAPLEVATTLSTPPVDGQRASDTVPSDPDALRWRCGRLAILGTRGIPAQHGGFETFAERLALYMSERGTEVTVYCQIAKGQEQPQRTWRGVRLIDVPVSRDDAWGTIIFDWKSTRMAAREGATLLTLGYNTGLFASIPRRKHLANLINMDGMEWKRRKWRWPERAWLYLNERCACWLGSHLIADHPIIAEHLLSRTRSDRITVIPYGADELVEADPAHLSHLGLQREQYALVIARPEPENSVLEIVEAFSCRPRGIRLIVLGDFRPGMNAYHRQVLEAASDDVLFPGAIYDARVLAALRVHCRLYIHGHTVGGTNPSLVEALGAGSAVLAHDNEFNRWVAGGGARYFRDADQCDALLTELLADPDELTQMRAASRDRHAEQFTWEGVLAAYDALLARFTAESNRIPARRASAPEESATLATSSGA